MKILLKVIGWVLVFFGFLAFVGAAGGGAPMVGLVLWAIFTLPLLYLDRDVRDKIIDLKNKIFPSNKKIAVTENGSIELKEREKLPELSDDELDYLQTIILKTDPLFTVTHKTKKVILFNYNKKEQKADCGRACCLTILVFPIGILYAILGGSKGYTDQVSIELDDDNYFIIEGKYAHKSRIIKQIKKSKFSNRLG